MQYSIETIKGKMNFALNRDNTRVVEKSGTVSYVIKDQLDGSTAKVYAESLRLANVTDWQISNKENNKQLRMQHSLYHHKHLNQKLSMIREINKWGVKTARR